MTKNIYNKGFGVLSPNNTTSEDTSILIEEKTSIGMNPVIEKDIEVVKELVKKEKGKSKFKTHNFKSFTIKGHNFTMNGSLLKLVNFPINNYKFAENEGDLYMLKNGSYILFETSSEIDKIIEIYENYRAKQTKPFPEKTRNLMNTIKPVGELHRKQPVLADLRTENIIKPTFIQQNGKTILLGIAAVIGVSFVFGRKKIERVKDSKIDKMIAVIKSEERNEILKEIKEEKEKKVL